MDDDYRTSIIEALQELKEGIYDQDSDSSIVLHTTRDFGGNDWDSQDMDAAYEEAEKKCEEARVILQEILEEEGEVVDEFDADHSWSLPEFNLEIGWIHEDKEFPCVVFMRKVET